MEVRARPLSPGSLHAAQAAETSRALKQFLYRAVYYLARRWPKTAASPCPWWGSCFGSSAGHPDRLPQPYARYRPAREPAHRVVCDYIAGMTDAFFRRTFEATIGAAVILPRS